MRRHRVLIFRVIGITVGCVLTVNTLVRMCGGAPHPLSPLHLGNKCRALAALAVHATRHAFGDPHPDPRATVSAAARRNGVPERLALSVARAESRFDAHAISHTGAMGLMQLMPDTAHELGVDDAFDPASNADGATRYLRRLLARYGGDRTRAVAAYNAGPGLVPRRGAVSWPSETQSYVRAVLGE